MPEFSLTDEERQHAQAVRERLGYRREDTFTEQVIASAQNNNLYNAFGDGGRATFEQTNTARIDPNYTTNYEKLAGLRKEVEDQYGAGAGEKFQRWMSSRLITSDAHMDYLAADFDNRLRINESSNNAGMAAGITSYFLDPAQIGIDVAAGWGLGKVLGAASRVVNASEKTAWLTKEVGSNAMLRRGGSFIGKGLYTAVESVPSTLAAEWQNAMDKSYRDGNIMEAVGMNAMGAVALQGLAAALVHRGGDIVKARAKAAMELQTSESAIPVSQPDVDKASQTFHDPIKRLEHTKVQALGFNGFEKMPVGGDVVSHSGKPVLLSHMDGDVSHIYDPASQTHHTVSTSSLKKASDEQVLALRSEHADIAGAHDAAMQDITNIVDAMNSGDSQALQKAINKGVANKQLSSLVDAVNAADEAVAKSANAEHATAELDRLVNEIGAKAEPSAKEKAMVEGYLARRAGDMAIAKKYPYRNFSEAAPWKGGTHVIPPRDGLRFDPAKEGIERVQPQQPAAVGEPVKAYQPTPIDWAGDTSIGKFLKDTIDTAGEDAKRAVNMDFVSGKKKRANPPSPKNKKQTKTQKIEEQNNLPPQEQVPTQEAAPATPTDPKNIRGVKEGDYVGFWKKDAWHEGVVTKLTSSESGIFGMIEGPDGKMISTGDINAISEHTVASAPISKPAPVQKVKVGVKEADKYFDALTSNDPSLPKGMQDALDVLDAADEKLRPSGLLDEAGSFSPSLKALDEALNGDADIANAIIEACARR